MTLRLLPDRHLVGAYNYLCHTEPFWGMRPKLLDADDVSFQVIRDRRTSGYFLPPMASIKFPTIAVSSACVGSTNLLMEIMAHEILHMYQWLSKTETSNTEHNAAFFELSKKVCKAHVFDIKSFAGEKGI